MRRTGLMIAAGLMAGLVWRPAVAADALIRMFTAAFLPQTVTIEVGDTVTWEWVAGEHTVTSGRGPDDPDAGALFDVPIDAQNRTFSLTLNEFREEGIVFFDRRHPAQIGFIEFSSGEGVFRVGVVDNVFLPEDLYIFEGDSVKWDHEPGEDFHTVTSGLSSLEPDHGLMFDKESSDARPIFVYQFTEAAVYPYFCRPHESMGMVGRIHVQARFVRGDTSGDGVVNLGDAVATLQFLFRGGPARPCADALDANDDGRVDLTDGVFTLLALFAGTRRLPPPYPRPGGDRTEDELTCWR